MCSDYTCITCTNIDAERQLFNRMQTGPIQKENMDITCTGKTRKMRV